MKAFGKEFNTETQRHREQRNIVQKEKDDE